MNAIERLREALYHATRTTSALERAPVPGTPIGDAHLALDAVDALYQAAAKVLDLDYGYEAGHPAWDALAAAVRRVEGSA